MKKASALLLVVATLTALAGCSQWDDRISALSPERGGGEGCIAIVR